MLVEMQDLPLGARVYVKTESGLVTATIIGRRLDGVIEGDFQPVGADPKADMVTLRVDPAPIQWDRRPYTTAHMTALPSRIAGVVAEEPTGSTP
jgi:hypothetical protein